MLAKEWSTNPDLWFNAQHKYDKYLVEKYEIILDHCEPRTFEEKVEYVLAHDQISRHCARVYDLPQQYVYQHTLGACEVAKNVLSHPEFNNLCPELKCFMVLPLRHSRIYNNVVRSCELYKKFYGKTSNPKEKALYSKFYMASITELLKQHDMDAQFKCYPQQHFITLFLMVCIAVCCFSSCGFVLLFAYLAHRYQFILGMDWTSWTVFLKCLIFDFSFKRLPPIDMHGHQDVTVSLSGGIDSILVLNSCISMRDQGLVSGVYAVHINYGNRLRSKWEQMFVENYCAYHDVPLLVRKITELKRPHAEVSIIERKYYEKATHDVRFRMYEKLPYPVLLGHNKDDCLENIFTNIKKKQHYELLTGMTPVSTQENITLIRPLLALTKEQIFDLARVHSFGHTRNSTPDWCERGRLRTQMLPFLRSYDSEIIEGLLALSERLKDNEHVLGVMFDKWFSSVQIQPNPKTLLQVEHQSDISLDMYIRMLVKVCHMAGVPVPSHKATKSCYTSISRFDTFKLPLSKGLMLNKCCNSITVTYR